MPNIHQTQIFSEFIPAQLYEGKRWYIGYWVKHPVTGSLERKQINFNRIKNIAERRKAARAICQTINLKLSNGWNPFLEDEAPNSFTKISVALQNFISQQQKALKDDSIRPDTLRSYTSYCKNITEWWAKHLKDEPYTLQFTTANVRKFLDCIYYERDNTPRTHNNYLAFIATLSKWMIERELIKNNPANGISTKREGDKKRTTIPENILNTIFEDLKTENYAFYTLCQTVYWCFIRRTEATKLKVSMVNLQTQTLTIPASISKNRKTQAVTLPKTLVHIFASHITKAANSDYLFSANFKPGKQALQPKHISDTWASLRKKLNLPTQYQFYSLKDSGITNLLQKGVPPIVVRDQARHHDISQTDTYTAKNTNLTHYNLHNL